MAMDQILVVITDTAKTQNEIKAELGMANSTISKALSRLRCALDTKVYIESWGKPPGATRWVPRYRAGSLPDAPHPFDNDEKQLVLRAKRDGKKAEAARQKQFMPQVIREMPERREKPRPPAVVRALPASKDPVSFWIKPRERAVA